MFVIDLSPIILQISQFYDQVINDFLSAPTTLDIVNLFMFKYWGWLLFVYMFLAYVAWPEYMWGLNNKWFAKNVKVTYLAIDVPKMNEQSIQAMENLFDHLQGAHGTFTKWAQYIEGEFQLGFSCELVSIEGNVQFIIRTPSHWRNLVEAAVYAQFTDAEITEVEDYTGMVPKDYPNETHDIWGCEFSLGNKNVFLPIKTYPKFEHRFSETFVDPMAALLETMSQIGPGEQIWLQILIKPLPVNWAAKEGPASVNKLLKIPPAAPKKGFISEIFGQSAGILGGVAEQLAGYGASGQAAPTDKKEDSFRMMNLTPGAKEQLEAMERKISKLAFDTKIRYIYLAEKDKMNKGVGVNGFIGAIKQWNDMNLNNLKPMLKETGTNSPQYVFINYRRNSRKNWLIRGYITRDTVRGTPAKPMCCEELASFWHFPSMYVKAPLMRRTEFKKAAAPVQLPFGEKTKATEPKKLSEVLAEKTAAIPAFDYDNDTFEMQFAKDKDAFIKSRPAREAKLKEIEKKEEIKLKEIIKKEAPAAKPAKNAKDKVQAKPMAAEEKKGLPENLPFID